MSSCEWCGAEDVAEGSTCPRSVVCPTCKAAPGSPCKRPSGHRAARLHAPRVELAEARDRAAELDSLQRDLDRDARYGGGGGIG